MKSGAESLLAVSGLTTRFRTSRGYANAVDGLHMEVFPGEIVGVVGESGSGKTMLALSILRLVPSPPGEIAAGEIVFKGKDLLALSEREMRDVRGNEISMIFQEPMTSLNPVFTVGEQVAEVLRLHQGMRKDEALVLSADLFRQVGIASPEEAVARFPHELSGGMRQRVVIAMALACAPDLILADEPTTALDVTIQAQILNLMRDLRDQRNASILLITHDLSVVAQTCKRVMVMYAGKIVESSDVGPLYDTPLHPYTQGLLQSLPCVKSKSTRTTGKQRLTPIPGVVPGLLDMPKGCAFHPRCARAFDTCAQEPPPVFTRDGRGVRCWLYA